MMMAKQTPKQKQKRKPQDITDYALRGLRNDIADLAARIEKLERAQVHSTDIEDRAPSADDL